MPCSFLASHHIHTSAMPPQVNSRYESALKLHRCPWKSVPCASWTCYFKTIHRSLVFMSCCRNTGDIWMTNLVQYRVVILNYVRYNTIFLSIRFWYNAFKIPCRFVHTDCVFCADLDHIIKLVLGIYSYLPFILHKFQSHLRGKNHDITRNNVS